MFTRLAPFCTSCSPDGRHSWAPRCWIRCRSFAPRIRWHRVNWIIDRARGLAALLEGRIDFLQMLPLDQLDRIEGTSGLKVQKTDEFRIIYLGLDQGSTELRSSDVKGANPFKDRRVRRAVYQAVDVEAIRTEVMHGLSRPTGVLNPRPRIMAGRRNSTGGCRMIQSLRRPCWSRPAVHLAHAYQA